jgi:hypothetical protein
LHGEHEDGKRAKIKKALIPPDIHLT